MENRRDKKLYGANRKPKLSDQERKARKKISDRNWRINNPDKVRARRARYDKRLRQATPNWLTKEQRNAIDEIYEKRPEGHHVDHIVPIKGNGVCGLHVPWNLQYLTAEENMKKKNKY